ncbi:MAG TPA: alpha-amylase family glycosyl hydrolase [Vicinamibacterales bacterium]|nr:alpha-amylase family glycosyl hydrolase [Vicinamibacterales bacterium]
MLDLQQRVGAWLTGHGCFFRVWAPHATAVQAIVQDEPFWKEGFDIATADLENDGTGYWSGAIAGVRKSQLYRFRITNGADTFETLDASARDVFSSQLTRDDPASMNASIVTATERLKWAPFVTPRFENFIVFELHVGSFAGFNDGLNTSWATFRQIEGKLGYIRGLGFNCIELMPVHEHAMDRSWGYNPASFFAPESSYGSPATLAHLVDAAHRVGLAVIIDVVYNHAGSDDNILYEFDGYTNQGGIYFEGGQQTDWGTGPAWWKREVQDFFYQNGRMYLEQYHADGLRFDATTEINGNHLKLAVGRLRDDFPDRYLIAEHLPDNPWIIDTGRFCATWQSNAHHECQRAMAGQDPLNKVTSFLGWDGYDHPWNLVKYTLGSHDDIGDLNNGDAEDGLTNWDTRHRYFVDQLGGRDNWSARAKCRLAWALNVAMPCTPMMFMGSECLMSSPYVSWGYWHDGTDRNGDHRFNWSAVDDPLGAEMRRLVAAANAMRWDNPALRADSLSIPHEDAANQVVGFVRESGGNVVLVAVNLSDRNFTDRQYGVATGGRFGQWTQILCTQDRAFGGWDGAGNAFYEPWTQSDGHIDINLPQWSVVVFRRR